MRACMHAHVPRPSIYLFVLFERASTQGEYVLWSKVILQQISMPSLILSSNLIICG